MRTLLLVLCLAACGGNDSAVDAPKAVELVDKCPWPERGLLRLTELSGNCGPQTPVVLENGSMGTGTSSDCVATDVQRTTCFRSQTVKCGPTTANPRFSIVSLWLDGADGVWQGESELQVGQGTLLLCQSHYAAVLDPR